MKLSLLAPYVKLPSDIKNARGLSEFLINEAINKKYPQGMPRTESRLYSKVLDQFYAEKDEIEVDDPTFLLIKEALDGSQLPATFSSWKWSLLEHLEKSAIKE